MGYSLAASQRERWYTPFDFIDSSAGFFVPGRAFRDSVDDYLEWCRSDGVAPDIPYSGKFDLSLSPSVHRGLALAARRMNLSIDRFVERAIVEELNRYQ